VLDFVDKALHEMALAVEPFIVFRRLLAVAAGWNDGGGVLFKDGLAKVIGIIPFICNDILAREARNQVFCLGNVVALAACQPEAQGVPECIYCDMDLGAEPPSAPPKRLGFLPAVFFNAPAAHGCARTMVLSISTDSMSGSSIKCACICSQMPRSHHRENRLYTVFQCPYSAGSNRHCAPLRNIHSTPSIKRRHVASLPIRTPGQLCRNATIFFQFSLESLTVLISPLYTAYVNRT